MREDKLLQVHKEIRNSLKALLLPLFAFTFGAFLLVFLTIWYISEEQDRIEVEESQNLLLTILNKEKEQSLSRVQDYAVWDTAYENLVLNLDENWAADYIGQYIHVTFPENRTYVIGEGNQMTYAAEEGIRVLPEKAAFYPQLYSIIDQMRDVYEAGDQRARLATYISDTAGEIWIAGISAIKPDFEKLTVEDFDDAPEKLHFLVFMRQLDGANLENIEKDFGFSKLTFHPNSSAIAEKSAAIFMNDYLGQPVGIVTWEPTLFGQKLLNQTLKSSAALLIVLVVLMGFVWIKGFSLLSVVNTTFRNLSESRRIAKMYERGITELVEGEFLYELSMYEALQKITINAAKTLGVDRVTIWRYDEKTDLMHNVFVHDSVNPEAEQKLVQFKLSNHKDLMEIIAGGKPVEFYSETKGHNLVEFEDSWWTDGVPSMMLSVPIVRHKLKEGIIFFSTYRKNYKWNEEKLRFAGAITDIVSLMMEVHSRNIIESELRTAKNRAEAANAAKSDFLANMSHELRTPLNAIIGFSDIMDQKIFGELGAPQYTEYTKDINVSARHLLALINDILEVSKHESGRFVIHPEVINLEEELNHAVRLARARFMDKKSIVTVGVAPEVENIEVDVKCFRQISLNLVSNAIKFSKGACILEISAVSKDGFVLIKVKDNGIGIPTDMQEKVFEAFSQVEHSLNKRYEGTGLGLAITKGLVELHGGKINLKSKPGQGTTVTVELPLQQQSASQEKLATG